MKKVMYGTFEGYHDATCLMLVCSSEHTLSFLSLSPDHTMILTSMPTSRFYSQTDVWGDAVNTASRMESHGVPSKIQISAATYHVIKATPGMKFEPRGKISVKGKGMMETYFVVESQVGQLQDITFLRDEDWERFEKIVCNEMMSEAKILDISNHSRKNYLDTSNHSRKNYLDISNHSHQNYLDVSQSKNHLDASTRSLREIREALLDRSNHEDVGLDMSNRSLSQIREQLNLPQQ